MNEQDMNELEMKKQQMNERETNEQRLNLMRELAKALALAQAAVLASDGEKLQLQTEREQRLCRTLLVLGESNGEEPTRMNLELRAPRWVRVGRCFPADQPPGLTGIEETWASNPALEPDTGGIAAAGTAYVENSYRPASES